MKYTHYSYPAVRIEVAAYLPAGEVAEYHLMLHAIDPRQSYDEQLSMLLNAYSGVKNHELQGLTAVFKRYFLSDAANQSDALLVATVGNKECACSVVEQAPLDGTKVALWVYLQSDVQTKALQNGLYEVAHDSYRHWWQGSAFHLAPDSEGQMRGLFQDYVLQLKKQKATLAEQCIRTWIYVQGVDTNYAGVVKARNEVFAAQNLTKHTHYIASTGIGGRSANANVLVLLDTYSVDGLQPGQIRFLYARTHLNPTYEYGVSFERGTYVEYGDRRQVFISGTASINHQGEIVHPRDIRCQTQRMWENVEALLKEADCTFEDMGHIIVYLRDTADYAVVEEMFRQRFPDIPKVITWAPVCRPGWLVEMECMGVKKNRNASYKNY